MLGDYWIWIVGAMVAAAVVEAWLRRQRGRPPRSIDNPKTLFRDLCWAHDLTRREISLLRSLADHRKLATPAMLFVQPSHFDVEKLGPGWQPYAARLADLRDRLFLEVDEAVTRA
jgi:hypothetical protein